MIDTLSEREKDVLERLVRGASLGKCFDEREFGFTWHGIRAILADCDDKQIRKTFYDVRQIELDVLEGANFLSIKRSEGFYKCYLLEKAIKAVETGEWGQEGIDESTVQAKQDEKSGIGTKVFIGHGRSHLWKDLKDFIQDRLDLPWDEFNRVPVAGIHHVERLSQMLDDAAIAFIVLTAEDEQKDGKMQARMNVIHETGLFQGRLGFKKSIVLLEEDCEEFSNIHGLGQIPFPKGNIKAVFEEIRRVLEREGLIEINREAATRESTPEEATARASGPTLRLELQKAKVFRVKSPAENRALVTIFITPNPTYLRKDTCSCFLTVPGIIKAQELPVYEFLETSVNVEKTDKREKADLNIKGPGYFEVHARASSVDATIPEDYTGPVQLTFRCVPEGPAGPMLTEEVNLTWVPEEGKPGGVWRYPTSQEEADDTGTQQEAEPKKLPKGTDITLNPRDPVFSVSAWQGGIPVENGWLTVMLDPANQGHEAGHITEISIENITTNSPLVGDTPMREVQYYRDNFPHGSEQVYLPIEVPPRTRDIALKLRIELPLSFENPQDFAAMLGRLGSYQLTVRYVYEDVDRKRFENTVEVPASFERFKSDRMNEWEQNKLFELLAIARAANG